MDVEKLIGEVAARNGIRIEPDDPAFALVTLNQLVLEEAVKNLVREIRAAIADFESAAERVQSRAAPFSRERLLASRLRPRANKGLLAAALLCGFASALHSELRFWFSPHGSDACVGGVDDAFRTRAAIHIYKAVKTGNPLSATFGTKWQALHVR